uniref:Uncharacterized protein n=1 Tax=Aegilops tauschii TaxID=37682 RepID=M8AX07_AEGTA
MALVTLVQRTSGPSPPRSRDALGLRAIRSSRHMGQISTEKELLEVEEGAAVRDVLAELDDGDPLVGVGLGAGAGVAEAVVDDELDGVGLLEDDAVEDLAAEAELEAEALGVGLGEDELGAGERDLEAGERVGKRGRGGGAVVAVTKAITLSNTAWAFGPTRMLHQQEQG